MILRTMRLRFAPSPTGSLHIGGARTALYNWLLARHEGGTLLLRIEDTDAERSTEENLQQILDALRWLELDFDEGPVFQSTRRERHQEALARLLESGHAYRSSATSDDVRAFKHEHGAQWGFRGKPEATGAVRLRVPDDGVTVVHDVIRGEARFEHIHMDDPVIARADGSVLYNFAAAIDDLDAAITHVVRGEDHLSNTPKQLLVLEAAREASLYEGSLAPELPVYAHLPLLYGRDGKKLSKRHGAASVQELRAAGYLPEAIRNYLALLGWGAGDDATVLSTAELIERFTLERVSRNPARFDEAKLSWLNGVYIRALPTSELSSRLEQFIVHDGITRAPISQQRPRLARATAISQEKIHTLSDFWPLAGFFFEERPLDPAARDRWLDGEGVGLLHEVRDELAAVARPEEPSEVKKALEAVVARARAKPRDVYQPLRVAISGTTVSPGIFESVALLGKDETLRRIDAVLADQGERQRGAGRAGETTSTPEA